MKLFPVFSRQRACVCSSEHSPGSRTARGGQGYVNPINDFGVCGVDNGNDSTLAMASDKISRSSRHLARPILLWMEFANPVVVKRLPWSI